VKRSAAGVFIERTAGKYYTTLAAIERMRELCRAEAGARDSGCSRPGETEGVTSTQVAGRSVTDESSAASLRSTRLLAAEMQMKFDFSELPLKNRAFSEKPMTFGNAEPSSFLSAIIDVIAIETGKRKARENWQRAQLVNMVKHAHERSAFWRKRIETRKASDLQLSDLPILTRSEVAQQVRSEGPLLHQGDGLKVNMHSTSGSSGTPLRFFISHMNTEYNHVRSIAQYFMEGRDLALNRTRLRTFTNDELKDLRSGPKTRFTVEVKENWLGPLGILIRGGMNKHINCWHPNPDLLLKELSKDSIGYLVSPPGVLDELFHGRDIGFLRTHKTEMVIPLAEETSPEFRKALDALGIPVRSSFSSEEVGLIASECKAYPSHYHIAHSNVVVEVDKSSCVTIDGKVLGRILLTHLHSYATPFIRYDVGDIGALADTCECGHDGPTLSNIMGRSKALIKHSDGRLTRFHIRASEMTKVGSLKEYRIRQTTLNTLILEIAGRDALNEDQHNYFVQLLNDHAGGDFNVDVRVVEEIDWGQAVKRLTFRNELI
jgi:phenylacetate-CoA ligase